MRASSGIIMPPIIHTMSFLGVAGWGGNALSDNTNWPAANRIIYIPISIPRQIHVLRGMWSNGNQVSGNVNLGVYDAGLGKLAETGTTAQSGTATPQFAALDIWLDAGLYYLALQLSSTSGRINKYALGYGNEPATSCTFYEDPGSFALPATATLTNYRSSNYFPLFGLDLRGSGL